MRENCDVSLACYDLGICSEMSQQIQGMAPDKNRCLLRSSWLINSAESLLKARGGSGSATAIAFQVGCKFCAFDSCAEIFNGSEMQLAIDHDPFANILQIMGEN